MRILAALLTAVLSLLPLDVRAQDSKAALETVSKAMGGDVVTSIVSTAARASCTPSARARRPAPPWPRFNAKSFNRGP